MSPKKAEWGGSTKLVVIILSVLLGIFFLYYILTLKGRIAP